QGRTGAREMTAEPYAGLPVRIAAPVAQEPDERTGRVERRRWDRSQQLAVVAARQAWADAGFSGSAADCGLDPGRVAVVVGSGIGGIITTLAHYDKFRDRGWSSVPPYTVTMAMPNGGAAAVSLDVGASGGTHAPTSACATGAEAVGQAVQLIRSGWADVVVAGGTEAAIHPFTVAGFAAMRALSRRNDEPAKASRPFDAARDGFVLGEGAGIVVVESAAHAASREAPAYAAIVGVGYSGDTYHVARADPDGPGARLAMRRALTDAAAVLGQDVSTTLRQVVHVNAHATSTPVGDVAEARAIRAVLGNGAVVTSTKSMTGHLLGAAGAVEAIAAILVLGEGVIPPTINLDEQDRDIELDIAAGEPRQLPLPAGGRQPLVVSNSFGFGGHNVTLAFSPAGLAARAVGDSR
ncbi:MAG: beta-ketoacyl-[acyl-carrier-protein] synthase family protein, partial [Actinobacteria bacterium]|nr:beta-ketoacyl-[acyl-carrier-protein] synthase family protein [Actinomycetota bacterium]